jgi:hypothetical protein
MGAISDAYGERFHQDISKMEKRSSGKWIANMLADYPWSLTRKKPTGEHKRHKKTK